jgi:hypothetical protein
MLGARRAVVKRNAYLSIFDGLADWEPAPAFCQIRPYGKLEVVPVGFFPRSVVTIRLASQRRVARMPEAGD